MSKGDEVMIEIGEKDETDPGGVAKVEAASWSGAKKSNESIALQLGSNVRVT